MLPVVLLGIFLELGHTAFEAAEREVGVVLRIFHTVARGEAQGSGGHSGLVSSSGLLAKRHVPPLLVLVLILHATIHGIDARGDACRASDGHKESTH